MHWFLFLFPLALTAQPLQRGNVDLRVGYETLIKTESQWATGWGEFSRDYLNTRVLDINLRQIGGGDSTVRVQWYFIGRDYDAKRLYIYDSGEFTGDIARGGVKLLPYSKELIGTREKLLGANRLTGSHPWGWCVIISQGNRLIEERASVPELIKWTLDNRDKLLAAKPLKKSLSLRFIPQAVGSPD